MSHAALKFLGAIIHHSVSQNTGQVKYLGFTAVVVYAEFHHKQKLMDYKKLNRKNLKLQAAGLLELCRTLCWQTRPKLLSVTEGYPKWIRIRRQDYKVEGPELTSSHENTQITANCSTTIDKKRLEPIEKVFYTQRQRRCRKMIRGALS